MRRLPPGAQELRKRVHVLTDLVDELGPMGWSSAVTLLQEISARAERVARLASDLATGIVNAARENGYTEGDAG